MLAKIFSGRSPQLYHDYRRTLFKVWRNDWSKSFFGRVRFTYQNKVLAERFAREATALGQMQIAAQTRDIAAKNERIHHAIARMESSDLLSYENLLGAAVACCAWLSLIALLGLTHGKVRDLSYEF